MQPQSLLAPSSSLLSHEAREPPPLPPTHRERCHRKGPGLCTSYTCPQNNLIYAAPQMRLSPQLLLGCVRLTVKTIFLDNVARSEHDAKGRKDYLVLHTSDFLERGQLPGHTDCFDFFKRESIKSHLHFTVQGSPRSLFGDSMVICRSGEEPTVCPPLVGQGDGSERSECQWL